jgi:xyloglucan galactosyltransferase MUR3
MMTGAVSVDLQSQKDATHAGKSDAGGGGMLRTSRICYVVVLATAFWASVLYLCSVTQGDNGGGEASVVLSNPSAFSLPLLSSITGGGRRPPLEQPPPVPDGKAPADRCAGRYIYMYDLPPRFNADLVRGCSKLRPWMDLCPYVANCGMGQALRDEEGSVSLGRGWYATDQFMLDVIFHCRMQRYACLTDDAGHAAAVFVPFYASLDGGRHLWNSTAARDALAVDLVAWLARRTEWRAAGGRDHFLVAGRTTWDFRRETDADEGWGTKLLNVPAVRNMTALVLESSPWHRGANLAVPYPTGFHPETAADVAARQEKARNAERRWLFSFVGAPRPGTEKTARAEIIRQCGASRRCTHFRCTKPSASAPSSCESSPRAVMRLMESSTFCLQPHGDTPTRRSTFDAVLAGCVPVFFHPESAYTQYTRHLPGDPTKYSVLILHSDIVGGNVSIEETLSRIPPARVAAMREEVIRLIPRVVYADPRSRHVDFQDAFDVALEAAIDRVAKRRREAAPPSRNAPVVG